MERFYNEYDGSIAFGNVDINNFDLKEWRNKIGYVQQTSTVMEDSLLNTITYGAGENIPADLIESSLKKVGIYEYINSLPEKLNTVLQEKGSNLSSGQLQRLMIARALIKQPDILLLDEITASLDSENKSLIKNTVRIFSTRKNRVGELHSFVILNFIV